MAIPAFVQAIESRKKGVHQMTPFFSTNESLSVSAEDDLSVLLCEQLVSKFARFKAVFLLEVAGKESRAIESHLVSHLRDGHRRVGLDDLARPFEP